MKINVKRIPVDGERFTGEDPATIMELEDDEVQFREAVRYELLAQVQGTALLVTGTLDTSVRLRCGRCLREFDQPLGVQEFVFHQELTSEDFADLTPQIREDMILELPQRALCDETCKGLCPHCGTDLNTGTCRCGLAAEAWRWQGLDKLKLKYRRITFMGLPKRRKSKSKMRMRRASMAYKAPQLSPCPQCGARGRPHRVCPSCGYYKGRQVLSVSAA